MGLLNRIFGGVPKKDLSKQKEIAQCIGGYYLIKNQGAYKKAMEEITELGITQVDVIKNKISIRLTRPGLLIGRRGANIDNLRIFLETQLKRGITIEIIEDRVISNLIPYSNEEIEGIFEDY